MACSGSRTAPAEARVRQKGLHMISPDRFERIRDHYGHYASWAIWAEEGERPKENIADLSVLDPQIHPKLFHMLAGEFIFLGLNISRKIERPFGNFHDPRPVATDFKIRSALSGTRFWGSYMTDIIKDFEEKASGRMMNFLRANKGFEEDNIRILKAEIELLGGTSPTLIAFGKDAEIIAKRNLGDEFDVIGIPHYANYTSREDYRVRVNSILGDVPSLNNAGQYRCSRPRKLGG
jgi:hypothetical protein